MKNLYLMICFGTCLTFYSCEKNSMKDENTPSEQPLNVGLIAYYPFNGNTNDESGNGYHLENRGALLADNKFGESQKAYRFNGTSDFMIMPKLLKADSMRELTISAWVRLEGLGHDCILSFIQKEPTSCPNFLAFENSSNMYSTWNQMMTGFRPRNCTSTLIRATIDNPIDKWIHIVLVQRYYADSFFSSYSYFQYYNGIKIDKDGSGFTPIPTSFAGGGMIGANNPSQEYIYNYDQFNGSIDNIRIYNRALSDDEVTQLYNLHE